jgi:hypothetical protein
LPYSRQRHIFSIVDNANVQLGLQFKGFNLPSDFSHTKSGFMLVYSPPFHAFAILAFNQMTGMFGQLQHNSSVSVVRGRGNLEYNFNITPMSCLDKSQLPFLSRSENIYKVRGYRTTEQFSDRTSHKLNSIFQNAGKLAYGLDCLRIH